MAVFGSQSSVFLSMGNLQNILIQSAVNAVIAAGMTFVIISGDIDLSVGSILALSSVVGAAVMVETGSVFLGCAVTLAMGCMLGIVNGLIVSRLGFPAFIVTLSTMWLYRGSAYVFTEGQAIVNLPEEIMDLALNSFLGIPNIIWLMVAVFVVCHIVLAKMTIGRRVYAVGDNRESSRLSGIPVKNIKLLAFAISGGLSALSGIILMSRLNSGQPIAGTTFELSAIAAAVIGGTSLTKGGVGGMVGTLIGAVFIATLQNGLVILNVSSFWQQVLMGVVVLLAVGIDEIRKKFAV
jgi:ribose/xylose/arabinose/galactoside ABC-type transport system permease subunit